MQLSPLTVRGFLIYKGEFYVPTSKKQRRSKYKEAYNKERRRIANFMRDAKARGYEFEIGVPKTAKQKGKVTKADVERLRKMTPDYLYSKATYTRAFDPRTGVPLSGKQGREYERSQAAKKGAQTKRKKRKQPAPQDVYVDTVLSAFKSILYSYVRSTGWDSLYEQIVNALETAIVQKGRVAVAADLEEHPEIIEQLYTALYYKYYQPASAAADKIVSHILNIPMTLEVQKAFAYHRETVEDWEEPD